MFFIPFLYRRLSKDDWTLKWYHIFLGPLLLRRGEVPPVPENQEVQVVPNYYRGHKTAEELEASELGRQRHDDIENAKDNEKGGVGVASDARSGESGAAGAAGAEHPPVEAYESKFSRYWYHRPYDGPWYLPRNLPAVIVKALMHGVDKDVVFEQQKRSRLTGDLEQMHARAPHFENKTEHLYSFLQVLTAATASFAHGSNDVANAMGPLSTIYYVWKNNSLKSKASVPIWVL
jgi:sodium-dependent phosphate transporter